MTVEKKVTRIFPCPTCSKRIAFTNSNPFRPFCSERCKIADQAAWASEDYRVAGEPAHLPDGANWEDDGNDY